jgi:inner membrane protein
LGQARVVANRQKAHIESDVDNLTHAALGLCAGLAVRRKSAPLAATVVAALIASELPDVDLLLRSAEDPLMAFRWHRHFSHSLLLWPLLAAIAATIAYLFWRRRGSRWSDLYPPALAAGLSHVLNDACTSYGTLILWPFSEARIAWDSLPIIDITLTLPLIILGLLAWKRDARTLAILGTSWFIFYAGLGRFQHGRAEDALLAHLGTQPTRLAIKPTISNLLLWRGIWEADGQWHTAAIRVGLGGETIITPGESRQVWQTNNPLMPPVGTRSRRLLEDFSRFTGGWNSVQLAEDGGVLVGDIRFAMLPLRADPLWAVHFKNGEPAHFEMRMDRRIREGDWDTLGSLLLGRPVK